MPPRVDASHTSEQFGALFANPLLDRLEPLTRVNLGATFGQNDWEAHVFVTNLTDETYVSGRSGDNLFYGAPRQYGVRITRSF
ncbi:MAG: TonB-dependent receptor [Hyphomonadaceae bacterium]|nr:TonB-dependent receptor [Hyphomonadaceae bacterium]